MSLLPSPLINTVTVSGGGAVSASAFDVTNLDASPFGHIDTPIDGSTGQAGAINFTGWALSPFTVSKVALCREPVGGEANVTDPHCLLRAC
jgi:hypothetical protein